MKNLYIAIVLILFLTSCSKNIKIVNKSEKESFVLACKISILHKSINEATGNKFDLFLGENNDLGLVPQVVII